MFAKTMSEREGQRAYRQARQELATRLQGELVFPGDPDYESARGVWNGAADRHPALIVRPINVADVIMAVNFAREQGIEMAVRSGGHSVPGYSTIELQHSVRSMFLRTLSDDVIHTIAEEAAAIMTPMTLVQVRVLGGAMSRVAKDATAFAHRDKQALVMITNFAPASEDAEPSRARTEQIWQALRPYADGVYVNFLSDEGDRRVHDAYPPATYARLAALKKLYDPTNMFHLNQNIPPARTGMLAA